MNEVNILSFIIILIKYYYIILELQLETELAKHSNGSSSTSSSGPSTGCGVWCGPMVCGCCASDTVHSSATPYAVTVDTGDNKDGYDNNAIDMDNV